MKKSILIIAILLISLPVVCLAQLDFDSDELFFEDFDSSSHVALKNIELIWSTDTYTPYEYQGRTLPSIGSMIMVEAAVEISGGDADSLKYSWFLEDIFQRNKSGYGKDSFYFYVNQRAGAYQIVRLQIFNEDRSIFEEKSIKIPIVGPELVIYSSNGNEHFSERTSEISLVLAGKKFSFIAKPYFFSIKRLTDLIFEWRFPGQEPIISSDYDAGILDLTISEKEDDEILENELWVSVINKKEARQKASGTIDVLIY